MEVEHLRHFHTSVSPPEPRDFCGGQGRTLGTLWGQSGGRRRWEGKQHLSTHGGGVSLGRCCPTPLITE